MAEKKFQFYEWWVPCSDNTRTHLYPKWQFDLKNGRRSICGLPTGGAMNGRYSNQPYCKDCLAKVAKAEDQIFHKLCKTNKRLILSILKQAIDLGKRAGSLKDVLSDEDE